MASAQANLRAKLSLDDSDWKRGWRNATNAASRAGKNIEANTRNLRSGMASAAKSVGGLALKIGSMAAKLAATLPKIVVQAASSTTWTVTHNRGRIVSVQTWVFNTDHYDVGAPISMRQDVDPYGTSTVTIEFGLASTGYVVII